MPAVELKPDYDEQQCYYCNEWFPAPVAYYHTEAECLENRKESSPCQP